MKNIIYILGIFLIFLLNSCEDLDREIITNISEEEVNTQYNYSGARATAMYTELPNGLFEIGNALIASAGDEAEHTLETSSIHDFNVGSWNEISNPGDVWAKYFKAIRNVNLFLENSDNIDLEIYRLDPAPDQQEIYKNRKAEIKRWKYEGRFLRAYYYFQLIKRYGGVPIIKNSMILGDEFENIQRSSLQDCINFITVECDSSAAQLPVKYDDTNLGRITKGAALALKAKVLLFAASDLWNTSSWASGFSQPELISLTSGDRNTRWETAANAAKAVIELEGSGYALADNYRNVFITSQSFQSPEHILVKRYGASNSFEQACWSIGFDMGKSGNTPSQNIVDAYEVKVDANTAVPFNWNNPEHAVNPYMSNRDPRLFANVIVNNSSYKGRTMEIWEGGRDGEGKNLATKTGYYLKKFLDENINLLTGTSSIHSWSLIRLADVYLWYAEALNEYDPGNADIKYYVDQIRQRPGVNMPPVPDGLSQSEMREVIRHERMVELAFEGHRVWDLRRWMTATSVLNAPLKGVEIAKTGSENFTYSVINVENRTFEPKMYFYPIPRQELIKMPNWSQNPLW